METVADISKTLPRLDAFVQITQNQPPKPWAHECFFRVSPAGYVAAIDCKSHKVLSKIQLPAGSLPMGTELSRDGKELYVSVDRINAIANVYTETNEVMPTIPV